MRTEQAAARHSAPLFWVGAAAILAAAVWLRATALDFGLPHLRTRPDETPILDLTALAARGEFAFRWAAYPNAYGYLHWIWGELGLRLLQAFGLAAPGTYRDALEDAPQRLYVIGRALSATAGCAAVAVVIASARRNLGPAAAIIGGALLATSFLHVRDSHFIKPDALLSLAIVVAIAAMVPLAQSASGRRAAVAGIAVGAAMATKYNGVALLAPIWAASVMGSSRHSGLRGWRSRSVRTGRLPRGRSRSPGTTRRSRCVTAPDWVRHCSRRSRSAGASRAGARSRLSRRSS